MTYWQVYSEWPEKLETLIPKSYFKITLQVQSETTRKIEYAIHD